MPLSLSLKVWRQANLEDRGRFETYKLEDINDANVKNLHVISDNVLAMIKKGEPGWEKFVPHKVEEAIKAEGLFDYPLKLQQPKAESVL